MADTNPYTQTITDEASGIEVRNNDYYIWEDGHQAGEKQERERIVAWGIEKCPHWSGEETRGVGVIKRDCSLCWQALKEGK